MSQHAGAGGRELPAADPVSPAGASVDLRPQAAVDPGVSGRSGPDRGRVATDRPERALGLHTIEIELNGRRLVGPLDLTIAAGRCTTVMGPSGCGKSTLLSYVAGTLEPAFRAQGRVTLGGTELTGLPPERRRLGLLFQDDLLFPHLSVGGNLAFALPPSVRGRAERLERIDAALAEAGLAGFAGRDPATLSGGQRARVALMRTLLAEPDALLLDEPFGKLDARRRGEIREFVFGQAQERGLPVLLVTHDEADARAAGGPIVELDAFDDEAG